MANLFKNPEIGNMFGADMSSAFTNNNVA